MKDMHWILGVLIAMIGYRKFSGTAFASIPSGLTGSKDPDSFPSLFPGVGSDTNMVDLVKLAIAKIKSAYPILSTVPTNLILAVTWTESHFEQYAKSGVGAVGLMQVLPSTYAWVYQLYKLKVPANQYGIIQNVLAGTLYLHYLYKRYEDWDAVVHAYNVGPGNYNKGIRNSNYHGNVFAAWAQAPWAYA